VTNCYIKHHNNLLPLKIITHLTPICTSHPLDLSDISHFSTDQIRENTNRHIRKISPVVFCKNFLEIVRYSIGDKHDCLVTTCPLLRFPVLSRIQKHSYDVGQIHSDFQQKTLGYLILSDMSFYTLVSFYNVHQIFLFSKMLCLVLTNSFCSGFVQSSVL